MRYSSISAEDLLQDLSRRIRLLDLKPGSMISENEMAEYYNVSRSTIRTIFSKLEQMKLVTRLPQIGTFISPFNLELINQIMYIRYLIELDAFEKLIDKGLSEELIQKLENNIKEQEKNTDIQEYENTFRKIDDDFHKLILNSVGLGTLMEVLSDHSIHLQRWRNFEVTACSKINLIVNQHKEIFQTLLDGDFPTCKKIVTTHLMSIQKTEFIEEMKLKYPEYF